LCEGRPGQSEVKSVRLKMASRYTVLQRRSLYLLSKNGFWGKRQTYRTITKFAYPPGQVDYSDNFSEKPEYPEIDPATRHISDHVRDRLKLKKAFHNEVKGKASPEEKNLAINMPR